MRTLTLKELDSINAAAAIALPLVVDKTMEFGAAGVLFNILWSGASAATIGHGLLMGAAVGASYGIIRSVVL